MSNFCNVEYLSERLAAVCKERDELKTIVKGLMHLNDELAKASAEKAEKIYQLEAELKRQNAEDA
jgi:hypothetical protein